MVYVLITNKYATLYELKYKYTIEEVIDMYEMCMCNISNKISSNISKRQKGYEIIFNTLYF